MMHHPWLRLCSGPANLSYPPRVFGNRLPTVSRQRLMSYSLRHTLVVFIFAFCQNFLQTECETFRYEKIGVLEFVGSPGRLTSFWRTMVLAKTSSNLFCRSCVIQISMSQSIHCVRSVPEIHVPVEMDCEITVAGRSENCRQLLFFRPSHDHSDVKNHLSAFCRQNSIVKATAPYCTKAFLMHVLMAAPKIKLLPSHIRIFLGWNELYNTCWMSWNVETSWNGGATRPFILCYRVLLETKFSWITVHANLHTKYMHCLKRLD